MLGRLFRATLYSIRVYGGVPSVLRAAFLAFRSSGISGVLAAISFAIKHSGRATLKKSPKYKKVRSVETWLEPLVAEAASIEPLILEIELKSRLADPIYFHSSNDLSETVKAILKSSSKKEISCIILGRINSNLHDSIFSKQNKDNFLQILTSDKETSSQGVLQGVATVTNTKEIPAEIFSKAIFHVLTTIQPSVIYVGDMDAGLKASLRNSGLIEKFSEIRKLPNENI